MNAETDLINKYIDKGVRYGKELIISKKYCNEFISSSKLADLAIVGIEGFYFHEDGDVEPVLDEIADFSAISADSWYEYLEKCISAARNFIELMHSSGKSNGYCFTLLNSEEKRTV